MQSSVAIAIDGVLRREIGHQPIPEGIALYHELAHGWNVVLLADGDDPAYEAEVEHFYHVEQLRLHSRTLYAPSTASSFRIDQLVRLRNSGLALSFVVEPDPDKSAWIFEEGFNVLHFMHAQYTRPQWRPDSKHEVVAWDDMVSREVALKRAKTSDKRTDR